MNEKEKKKKKINRWRKKGEDDGESDSSCCCLEEIRGAKLCLCLHHVAYMRLLWCGKLMWMHSHGLLFCQKSTPENVSRWATTDMGSLRSPARCEKAYPQ